MRIQEVYKKITNQIQEKLQQGTLPWKKSWIIGLPQNMISKHYYTGINFLSLCTADYPSPFYMTFLQCKEKEGFINAGERGNLIVFWKMLEPKEEQSGNQQEQQPYIQYSYVFNLSQTTLYKPDTDPKQILDCEKIITEMKVKPVIKNNHSRCCYYPTADYISLPKINDFNSPEDYYSTLFHELVHWTGHQERLNRFVSKKHMDEVTEELVAELGSSFLCGLCGISATVIDSQASYIDGWLSRVEKDPVYFIRASSAAHKAVSFILNKN